MEIKGSSKEAERIRNLKRMKIVATTLLVIMVFLYIVSRYLEKTHPLFSAVAAFSEAAMVGALADWFAVTALFRHPLNIPIPHTAVIPRNKDRFGDNLSRFIRDNFLSREAVENKLRNIDFARWILESLYDEKNIKHISKKITLYLEKALMKFDDRELKAFVMDELSKNMNNIRILPFFGKVLESFAEENRHQEVLDEVLTIIEKMLDENKMRLLENMRKENPWWMPDFIDDVIFNRVIGKVEENLEHIRNDRNHEIRVSFNNVVHRFINDLKESESFSIKEQQLKTEFFRNEKVKEHFIGLWNDLKNKILNELRNPTSTVSQQIETIIFTLVKKLESNKNMQERLNVWFHDSILNLTHRYSDSIITIISDTVRKWDAEKTSRRIELYVGKDLQWIRINGTLVGGLVGLFIYYISRLFNS